MSGPALEVAGLTLRAGARLLVEEVGFEIAAGEVLGLVGESGSGKSVTAAAVAGLLPAGVERAAGAMRLDGVDLCALDHRARRALSGRAIGMVFQDPMSAFNPVKPVGDLLIRGLMIHQGLARGAARRRAVQALGEMRLPEPERLVDAFPHQISGGQRQRVMIALALINNPGLLIADEPTTALDATVQRQILALLKARAAGRGLLFITHDLGAAAALCDRIAVMHRGRIIECAPAATLIAAPQTAYTGALIAARRRLGAGGAP